jgi:FtsH-binding integral membrane protein
MGLTLYAFFTTVDFATLWAVIIVLFIASITFGIFCIWFPVLENLYCSIGVAIFGIYLVFDTQMIVGGKRFELSLDDYTIGALILYLDIIQIFL